MKHLLLFTCFFISVCKASGQGSGHKDSKKDKAAGEVAKPDTGKLTKPDDLASDLKGQIEVLRDSLQKVSVKLHQKESEYNSLKDDHSNLLQTLKLVTERAKKEEEDKKDVEGKLKLLGQQAEQFKLDHDRVVNLNKEKDVLSSNLKIRTDSISKLNRQYSDLVKVRDGLMTNQNSLTIRTGQLEKENNQIKQDKNGLQKNNESLTTENKKLRQKITGTLEADVTKAINDLTVDRPEDYARAKKMFEDFRQRCQDPDLKDFIQADNQLRQQCEQLARHISLLETLDKARQVLDSPFNSRQLKETLGDLNARKTDNWRLSISVKINNYISSLEKYCKKIEVVELLVHQAALAVKNDLKVAQSKLQDALNEVDESEYPYLERMLIERQNNLTNRSVAELPKVSCP